MQDIFLQPIRLFRLKSKFTSILISLISLCLALCIVFSFFFTRTIIRNTTKQQAQMNRIYLATIMDNTDYLLRNLHQSLTQLTLSHSIFRVALLSESESVDNEIGLAVTDLSQATSSNLLIKSSVLYIKKLNYIITSSYKSYSLSYSPFRDLISYYYAGKANFQSISADTKTSSLFYYKGDFILARDFPLNDQKRLATIFYYINTHELYRHLTGKLPAGSNLWVYDGDGIPLFPNETNYPGEYDLEKINQLRNTDGDYLISNRTAFFRNSSEFTGWDYYYIIDESRLRPSTGSVLAFLIPLMLALIAVSSIVSILLAYNLYEPFRRLLVTIENKNLAPEALHSSKDEVEYLNYAFTQIAGHSSELESMVTDMQDIMENVSRDVMSRFFLDRISGSQVSPEKVDEVLAKIKSPYRKNDYYIACVMKCTGNKPFTEGQRVAMITELRDILPSFDERKKSLSHLLVIDGQTFALILSYNEKTPTLKIQKDLTDLEKILRSLMTKKDYTMRFSSGNLYHSILDVGFSYKEALTALSEGGDNQQAETSSRDNSRERDLKTRAQQVLSFVLKNDAAGAGTLANRVINNISELPVAAESRAVRYRKFITFLIEEIMRQKEINTQAIGLDALAVPEALSGESPDGESIDAEARQFCEKIIQAMTDILKKQNHHHIVAAQEYIIRNSTDINLSLNMIAEIINVNPSYLSRLFISNLGVHFTDYLNEYRIENSKRLLEETNLSIKEVALQSGFSTVQNYIRVFKKHVSMTPGAFRNDYIINNKLSG